MNIADDNEKLIAKIIYQNCLNRDNNVTDLEKADMSFCKEELSSILGDRPLMPSARDLIRVLRFFKLCGFDCNKFYIVRKDKTNAGVRYIFCNTDNECSFAVDVEEEWFLSTNDEDRVVAHVGIVLDMD